jgi:hypothetical protein
MININSRSLHVPVLTYDDMTQGAIRKATVNFVNAADKLSTTVSSVAWAVKNDSDLVTISSEALSSGVATATITATDETTGCAIVTVTATMANGQKVAEHLQISVKEIDCDN